MSTSLMNSSARFARFVSLVTIELLTTAAIVSVAGAAFLPGLARAQGGADPADPAAPIFLGSGEVKDALVDKPWTGRRGVYGALTQINFKSDHHAIEIFFVDTSTTRKGTWSLDDQGQMCISWAPNAATNCYRYAKSGVDLIAFDLSDPLKPHAELHPRRSQ